MSSLFYMLALFAAVLAWRSNRAASEAANVAARAVCTQNNVQFLDQTVVFRRFDFKGKIFRRVFSFDYCPDGRERFRGMVWMRGSSVDFATLDAASTRDIVASATVLETPAAPADPKPND